MLHIRTAMTGILTCCSQYDVLSACMTCPSVHTHVSQGTSTSTWVSMSSVPWNKTVNMEDCRKGYGCCSYSL